MRLDMWLNFPKFKNSTKQPVSDPDYTLNIDLKGDDSILSPLLKLQGVPSTCVYARIHELGRYYFVKDARWLTNDIVEYQLEIDPLASYKSVIGASTHFIERSSHDYNDMFIDNYVSSTQDAVSIEHTLTSIPGMTKSDGCYIVRVVDGTVTGQGGICTYAVDDLSELRAMFSKSTYYVEGTNTEWWEKAFYILCNPMEYIVSVSWCPFTTTQLNNWGLFYATKQEIYLKWWNTGINAYQFSKQFYTITSATISMPNTPYTDFRKYTPSYTQYKIYLPGAGVFDLSPQDASLGNMFASYTIDFFTGDTAIKLCKSGSSDSDFIASYNANIYEKIQISADNVATGSTLVTTGGALVGALTKANAMGFMESVINAVNCYMIPTSSVNGSLAGGVNVKYYSAIIVIATSLNSGAIPINTCGRPLMEYRQISTIPGYIKCGNASLSISCTDTERDAINNYLNSGFYYE